MKLITSLLLAVLGLNSMGGTNCPLAAPQLFSLATVRLQTPIQESEKTTFPDPSDPFALDKPEPAATEATNVFNTESVTNGMPERVTLNAEEARMLRYFTLIERGGYLNPTPPPPETLYTRTVHAIFQPETIPVGKTFVSFSPLTAIKRKNPLALLNPIVLNIAW